MAIVGFAPAFRETQIDAPKYNLKKLIFNSGINSEHMMKVRPYKSKDLNAVVSLWGECNLISPKNDPVKDVSRKLQVNPDWLLVGEKEGGIVASIMLGYEGHRGWLNYLAVKPAFQRRGYGKIMVDAAESELKKVGCPKINIQIRHENKSVMEFYKKLGFIEDPSISMGKRLVDDFKPESEINIQ